MSIKKANFVVKNKNLVFVDSKAVIGENVIIYENTRIDGHCIIGDNVTIFPNSHVINSVIGKGTKIYSSFIENSEVGACCSVGAFSCIKGGTKISSFVRMGSGVVIKNSEIANHSEIGHNSTICGTKLGQGTKVSAGVVFAGPCDKSKPKIDIDEKCVIGANSCISSLNRIKRETVIAPGTTI